MTTPTRRQKRQARMIRPHVEFLRESGRRGADLLVCPGHGEISTRCLLRAQVLFEPHKSVFFISPALSYASAQISEETA
jgi:hypothetical protein